MSPRYTWLWVGLALGLFAFIALFERHWHKPAGGPLQVLPELEVAAVTSVQVRPAGQLEIRAEQTNRTWSLTRPLSYPAEAARIEALLTNLAGLRIQTYITGAELRQRTNTDQEYGFDTPLASLLVQQRDRRHQVLVGALTAPGDQVFLQVVGAEGLYVVGAELLGYIPRSADDWREVAFARLDGVLFDRIVVTNAAGTTFELRRGGVGAGWRLTEPLQARAAAAKVEAALSALQHLRVARFVSDDPNADVEAYGLHRPELALTFADGSNAVVQLQFGGSVTNGGPQAYARRLGQPAIVTVAREALAPWQVSYTEFRDRHLLTLARPVVSIEVPGENGFTVRRLQSGDWRLLPLDLPADVELVEALLNALTGLQVTDFVKDVVIEPDLPKWGLAPPVRQFTLWAAPQPAGDTNLHLGTIAFGTTEDDKTYVRRPDETSVYKVKAADFQHLPTAAFQLRDRRIWNLQEANIERLQIEQSRKTRQLIRQGTNSWTLAPGSQGIINSPAVEETVHRLAGLYAISWVAVGEQQLARYGFTADGLRVTLELRTGDKLSLQLGGTAPAQTTYAATVLEGQVYIFECPPAVSELVRAYLAIPADVP